MKRPLLLLGLWLGLVLLAVTGIGILDNDNEFVEYCHDDPDGAHPYRGMTLEAITLAVGPIADHSFENVGAMLDFFCGYDWGKWCE